MEYTHLPKRNFVHSLYKSEEQVGAEALQKAEEADIIIKGRKAEPLGSRKNWGGIEYVKTAQGWSASKKVKAAHDTIHGSGDKKKLISFDDFKNNAKVVGSETSEHGGVIHHVKHDGEKHLTTPDDKAITVHDSKDPIKSAYESYKADHEFIHGGGANKQLGTGKEKYNALSKEEKEHLLTNTIGVGKQWVKEDYDHLGVSHQKAVDEHFSKEKPKEVTPDEHRAEAAKHFDEAHKEYFKGDYKKQDEHHAKGHEHLMHALGKEKDKFNAVYNNPEVKHITVGGTNKPLSSQLQAIHGDHYNAQDYDGDANTGSIITHKKSGQKYTVINHKQADLVKHYQGKNKEGKAAPDFDKISKKLKGLTAANNHTEALHHLAKEVGHKEAEEKIGAIKKQQDKQGYLSMDQSQEKYGIYKDLMNHIKEKHGEEAHKKIHSSL